MKIALVKQNSNELVFSRRVSLMFPQMPADFKKLSAKLCVIICGNLREILN